MQKIDRLIRLNSKLNDIVQFDDDLLKTGAIAGGGALAGAGGLKAYQLIKNRQATGLPGVLIGGEHAGSVTAPAGRSFGQAAGQLGKEAVEGAGQQGKSILERAMNAFRAAKAAY